jgi:small-conductance mechanosensitive channel
MFINNRIQAEKMIQNTIMLLLIFSAIFIPQINAQTTPGSEGQQISQTDTLAVEVPIAIPASEVAMKAEETTSKLQKISANLDPLKSIQNIENELPAFLKTIQLLQNDPESSKLKFLSLENLKQLQEKWIRDKDRINSIQTTLSDRSKSLEAEKQKLKDIKEVWQKTLENSQKKEYPEAVVTTIHSLLERVEKTESKLAGRLDIVLTLQSQVSEASILISEKVNEIERAAVFARSQLFARDGQPIWKAFVKEDDEVTLLEPEKTTFDKKLTDLTNYAKLHSDRFFFQFVFFLLLSAFLIFLNRQSQKWQEDHKKELPKTSIHVLSRPVSVALFITLIFNRIFHPSPPTFLANLYAVIAVIPLLRILPGLVLQQMRPLVYLIVGLFVVQRIHDLSFEFILLQRVILIFLSVSSILGFLWLLKLGGKILSQRLGRHWLMMKLLAQLSTFFIAAALSANFIGYISLSQFLIMGIVRCTYIALLLFAAVLIIDGLIKLLLRTGAAKALRRVQTYYDLWNVRGTRFLNLIAYIIFVNSVLKTFNLYNPFIEFISGIWEKRWIIGSLNISLGDILLFFITIWLSVILSRFIRFVLDEDVLPRMTLPRGVPNTISMVVYYVLLSFGFIVALSAAGIEWSKFALLAGALGVGIGFGLQNLVNNFISGLILIFERPIKVGDTIQIATLAGIVQRIGIRASNVRTFDGAEVVVPNGNLLSSELTNWTLSDQKRRIEIPVGVSYNADPNKIPEVLLSVLKDNPDVMANPQPVVLFRGFGESSLDFSLRFWTENFGNWVTLASDTTFKIHNALKDAGVEIPFPQRDLHLRSVDSDVKFAVTSNNGKPKAKPAKTVSKTENK